MVCLLKKQTNKTNKQTKTSVFRYLATKDLIGTTVDLKDTG